MSAEIKIIKEFLTKMKTQDNRSTGQPYFFVIRNERWLPSTGDHSGDSGPGPSLRTVWVYNADAHVEYESEEEVIKAIEEEEGLTEQEVEDMLEDDYTECHLIRVWEHKGMFLTETDAKEHFSRNRYHYSENAHVYVDHAWRAPELEGFLNSLFKYFDIKERSSE